MARSPLQKLRILYIIDHLLRRSDEKHPITTAQLISMLSSHGISAERKSICDDIEALGIYGVDILSTGSGRNVGYYVGIRSFQLAELKLLVDSVQSSKFITEKKALELIQKNEGPYRSHPFRISVMTPKSLTAGGTYGFLLCTYQSGWTNTKRPFSFRGVRASC